jgi:hypothetical protein
VELRQRDSALGGAVRKLVERTAPAQDLVRGELVQRAVPANAGCRAQHRRPAPVPVGLGHRRIVVEQVHGGEHRGEVPALGYQRVLQGEHL